jgi:hypothetical protein
LYSKISGNQRDICQMDQCVNFYNHIKIKSYEEGISSHVARI